MKDVLSEQEARRIVDSMSRYNIIFDMYYGIGQGRVRINYYTSIIGKTSTGIYMYIKS